MKPPISNLGQRFRRLEAVERLILESQQRYPNNLDAGIEHAMREMHSIISEAEDGNAEAVAEVGFASNMSGRGLRRARSACKSHCCTVYLISGSSHSRSLRRAQMYHMHVLCRRCMQWRLPWQRQFVRPTGRKQHDRLGMPML